MRSVENLLHAQAHGLFRRDPRGGDSDFQLLASLIWAKGF
jgi:hypothetical protein